MLLLHCQGDADDCSGHASQYVVVQSERRPEMANRQEASELNALKPSLEGAGIPRPLRSWVDLEI